MKRASYRRAIEFIALNDNPGADDAYEVGAVEGLVSTSLVSEIFGVEQSKVAVDVVRTRHKLAPQEPAMMPLPNIPGETARAYKARLERWEEAKS